MQEKSFEIVFYKNVASPYGWEQEVPQGRFKVTGLTRADALREAAATFCRARNQHDWRIHADRYEIRDLGD